MATLREFIEENKIELDEFLDTFYITDIDTYNKITEKILPNINVGVMFAQYYISESTKTLTIKRTEKFKPQFYSE